MYHKLLWLTAISLFIFTTTSSAQTAPTPDQLKKFRTGTFEYTDGIDKGVIVKRTRKKQYEYDPVTKEKIVAILKVKWLSDDQYTLTLVEDPAHPNIPKGVQLLVKITSATNDTYTCHWELVGDKKGEGTTSLRKIK